MFSQFRKGGFGRNQQSGRLAGDDDLWLPKGVRPLAIGACGPAFFAAAAVAGSGSTTTWSPTDKVGGWSLSNGNLTAQGGYVGTSNVRATSGSVSGRKEYWLVRIDQIGTVGSWDSVYVGAYLGPASQSISSLASPFWTINGDGTVFSAGGSGSGGGGALANNDVLMFAFDHTAKRLYFGVNGTWRNSGDPAAGTGYVYTFTATNSFFPGLQADNNDGGIPHVLTINCGASGFPYSLPSGFTALGAP